jgi:hypothetical protein
MSDTATASDDGAARPQPAQDKLLKRVREYLGNGGLFNPELMNSDKVRELVMDLAAARSSPSVADPSDIQQKIATSIIPVIEAPPIADSQTEAEPNR